MDEIALYWPSGRLKRKCQFVKGVRHGLDQMYSESGVLVDEGEYEMGKPVGTHRRFNKKGNLIEEIEYLDRARFNLRRWDDEGQIHVEAIWIDEKNYRERLWDRFQGIWVEKRLYRNKRVSELFFERFPKLSLLSHRWVEGELPQEKVKVDPAKAEVFYFYGLVPSVYFQCKNWLQERAEKRLVFLEDDPGVFAAFLKCKEALEILKDEQVHLEFFSKGDEEIEALAGRFPMKRIEVAALKSKKGAANLRLKLLRKTALAHALYLDRLHGYQPFQNFIENVKRLHGSFYANGLKGAFQNVPAIICGAGPSLKESIDLLRKLEKKALIIAGGSTLAALSSQGVQPHFGMAIDPNLEEYRRLKNSFAFEVPLLYSTRVHPDVFQTCNGPFGYMRSGVGGIPELWMEEELNLTGPFIGETLSSETVSVTAHCVAWAHFLGCSPILLNGVDMAYTGGKHYSDGVVSSDELKLQEIDKEKSAADRVLKRKNRSGKTVFTAVRWIMESKSISDFASNHPDTRFINTTEGGIGFKNIDYVPLEVASLGFEELDLRDQILNAIRSSPMPQKTEQRVSEKISELGESLHRLIEHLQILADEKKGSKVLAEMDLKEEIAYLYLFYDIEQIFKKETHFFKKWLDLAQKYKKAMDHDADSTIR